MNSIIANLESNKSAALYGFYSSSCQRNCNSQVDKVLKNGVMYLESSYSLLYGWIPETSSSENLNESKQTVPIIYDTAFILDELSEAGIHLSCVIKERAIKWIKDQQVDETKTWNYFGQNFYMIPHDPDCTSNVICCLYGLNELSKHEAKNLAENMVKKIWFHDDDGLMDVYFKGDCSYVWPKWKMGKRVDAGVIANVLYCLGRLGMTDILDGEKFDACFSLLNDVINDMQMGKKSVYLKNFENFDIALFLFSRVVKYSEKAKKLFGMKIETLVGNRLGKKGVALQMSCRLLAAINVGMIESFQDLIVKEARILIGLADVDEGGWPKYAFYSAHKTVYFGSKAVTTCLAVAGLQKLKMKLPHVALLNGDKFKWINFDHNKVVNTK